MITIEEQMEGGTTWTKLIHLYLDGSKLKR
jgi:hypothetical protein